MESMLVVVGGHSRKIGKSSVVTGLIRALPEGDWVALKITQHGHRGTEGRSLGLVEEAGLSKGDSGRYLRAGAVRSFFLATEAGSLKEAIPAVREAIGSGRNAIVESNSLLEFLPADLILFVLDFSVEEFKEASRQCAGSADAFVVVNQGGATPAWAGEAARWLAGRPSFRANPPEYVTDELAAFVRKRLAAAGTRRQE